ncbi:MAG: acetoin utilization protein AcuC, partial [Aquificae bacterium]|nr:acetoin utilization protein AcuC [Aquificota bacterium]
SGRKAPEKLTHTARQLLLSVEFEEIDEDVDRSYMLERLKDPYRGGKIREEVKKLARELRAIFAP